jgi:hypothetical protein
MFVSPLLIDKCIKKIDIILRKGNVFNEGNTTMPISGAGTVYPSGAPEFTPSF